MIFLIIVYGLIIGSFLNVCIYRIPEGESICFPHSHCRSCGKKINWYDNIPIFSYLLLKGKCRNCMAKISIRYPAIEILNATTYIILFKHFNFNLDFLFFATIMSSLIVVCFIDLNHMIIPDRLIVTTLILEVLHKTALFLSGSEIYFKSSLLGAVLAGLLFLIIVILSKGGMGDGDITLIVVLGFILGVKLIFLNVFLSFLIGAVISIFLLLFKIKTKKDPIPFGPFIITAFFITLLFGEKMINLYLELFI